VQELPSFRPGPARRRRTRRAHHLPLRHSRSYPKFTTLPGPWLLVVTMKAREQHQGTRNSLNFTYVGLPSKRGRCDLADRPIRRGITWTEPGAGHRGWRMKWGISGSLPGCDCLLIVTGTYSRPGTSGQRGVPVVVVIVVVGVGTLARARRQCGQLRQVEDWTLCRSVRLRLRSLARGPGIRWQFCGPVIAGCWLSGGRRARRSSCPRCPGTGEISYEFAYFCDRELADGIMAVHDTIDGWTRDELSRHWATGVTEERTSNASGRAAGGTSSARQ
jgi:hypothetical protein